MPVISFAKKNRPNLTVDSGSNLMKSLLEAEIPVASSCHGDGVCGKCKLTVVSGALNLSTPNETELFLAERYQLKANQRISCQTAVLGDVEIDAGYW